MNNRAYVRIFSVTDNYHDLNDITLSPHVECFRLQNTHFSHTKLQWSLFRLIISLYQTQFLRNYKTAIKSLQKKLFIMSIKQRTFFSYKHFQPFRCNTEYRPFLFKSPKYRPKIGKYRIPPPYYIALWQLLNCCLESFATSLYPIYQDGYDSKVSVT